MLAAAVGLAGAAKGRAGIHQGKLRMTGKKIPDLTLVFFRREGAGGVHQHSAGSQQGGSVVQDLPANGGTLAHQALVVLGQRLGLLTEHALTGAGCVHQNTVKKCGESLDQSSCIAVQHNRIGYTHPLQVGAQDLGPACVVLVAHQQALALQGRRQLTALAAGRSAHVQHLHAGVYIQQRRRSAG